MSKELAAFKRFRHNAKIDNKTDYHLSTQYIDDNDIIESALKALEIIKEKDPDVGWLKRASNLYHYNMGMGIKSYGVLTQEEYDLLKEVLL